MKKGILDDAMPESIYFCRIGAFLKLSQLGNGFIQSYKSKRASRKLKHYTVAMGSFQNV